MNSYLYLNIKSSNISRFLIKCNKNYINILKIDYVSYKSINILINEEDYNKLLKIRGTSIIKVIKVTGKKRYKILINKYKIFIFSFIIGIMLLLFLSNIIFEVEIVGNNNKLNELLYKELENYNIMKYSFKKSYKNKETIKKKIKNKYHDNIEWIEIKESGVKYIVNYVERKIDKDNKDNKKTSIIARKSGIIRGIFTSSGISLVEKGNYVSKGDILITSDIILNDEIKNKVKASGKIYAETWYRCKIEFPINYKEKVYTNKKRNIFYIRLGKKYFEPFRYKNFSRKKIFFYKNKLTNIEIGFEKLNKEIVIKKKYNNNTAIKKAKDKLRKTINLKLNDKEHIIDEKTLNFYNNGSKIILDEFFSIYEEIGEEKEIESGEFTE